MKEWDIRETIGSSICLAVWLEGQQAGTNEERSVLLSPFVFYFVFVQITI